MAEFAAEIKELGDKIAGLTLKQASELAAYLKEAYGIEAAAGGAVMMAPAAAAPAADAAPAAPSSYKVTLKSKGGAPIPVIKVVRAATGLGLKEAKDLVDGAPKTVKGGLSKEDAEKLAKELTEAGAEAEVAGE